MTLDEIQSIERRLSERGLSPAECQRLSGAVVLLAERPDLVPDDDAEFYRKKLRELGELQ